MEIEIGEADDAEIFIVMFNGMEYTKAVSADAAAIDNIVKEFYS